MAVDQIIEPHDPDAGRVRFGRNRFLAALGGGLFGFATSRVLRAEPALAQHEGTPWPGGGHSHCPTGGQYWETCTSNGNRYRCRDWHEKFPGYLEHHCICVAGLGRC